MKVYAVIDTNVIVSALISKNPESPPVRVLREALCGKIISLYHSDIIAEYTDVLILITNKTIDKKSSHNPYTQDYARFFV